VFITSGFRNFDFISLLNKGSSKINATSTLAFINFSFLVSYKQRKNSMAESDTVGDFSKRMRPITPNEIAAMRRLRLCQNKYRANIKLIKNDYLVTSSHLIREKFEAQIELASISISKLRKNV